MNKGLTTIASAAWTLCVFCSTPTYVSRVCVQAGGMPGPEDFELDIQSGPPRLLVSAQDRRKVDPDGEMAEPGQIFQVPLGRDGLGTPTPLNLTERDGLPFHPHGITQVRISNQHLLYVINHPMIANHAIEVFEIRANELRFLRRLRSPYLISPNDLVVLPNGEIYVTNDHGKKGFLRLVEDLFGVRWANVAHMKDDRWEIVAENFSVANGIAVSEKADNVYVAATRDRGIHVFQRDSRTGNLKFSSFINIRSGVDNLLWEQPSVLNVASHPSLFDFLSHYKNKENASPSEIYRVKTDTGQFSLIYSNDGKQLSAASTGLVYNGRLFVSQVFEPAVISCTM